MDASWLKKVGGRDERVADMCRLFMDYTVVVQAGNRPWGIGLGSAGTCTYMLTYIAPAEQGSRTTILFSPLSC